MRICLLLTTLVAGCELTPDYKQFCLMVAGPACAVVSEDRSAMGAAIALLEIHKQRANWQVTIESWSLVDESGPLTAQPSIDASGTLLWILDKHQRERLEGANSLRVEALVNGVPWIARMQWAIEPPAAQTETVDTTNRRLSNLVLNPRWQPMPR